MTRHPDSEPMAFGPQSQSRSRQGGLPGRSKYDPPRIERFGTLDRVARFGGSNVVDSGSGNLGNQSNGPRRG